MTRPIPAAERNALFPFMVQRRNPTTGRWLNVSAQPSPQTAHVVAEGIKAKGHEARVSRK